MQNDKGKKVKKRNRPRNHLLERDKTGHGNIMYIIFFGLFTGFILILLFFSMAKGKKAHSSIKETVVKEITETNPTNRNVRINNISIAGLSLKAAKERILDSYDWDIQLSYEDFTEPLKNPLPEKLDVFLKEIYSIEESLREEHYKLDFASLENNIRKQVSDITSKWNRSPVKAQLTDRDKETGSWIYTGGENGVTINQEKAVEEIMASILGEQFTAIIGVLAEETHPNLSASEIKEKYQVIGTFSTTATNNRNRNQNISLAVEALDGLVIFPGEEFSFNKATGNRTKERGYMPAGAYRNGEFVEEPGGGVCQVSSTLYNAIIFSGIMTTERNPHSFEPSYVIPGEDAMVSYDGYSGPDLRFINKQDTSVAIRAVFKDRKLTISIIGIPILSKGTEVSMSSEKTKEYDPPAPNYVEDQTLLPGQEVVVKEGVKGTTWKTLLVTSKDGTVIDEEYFHTSTYRGKAGTVKRNTSGVVILAPEKESSPPIHEEEIKAGEMQPEETVPAETAPEEGTFEDASEGETTETQPIGPGL